MERRVSFGRTAASTCSKYLQATEEVMAKKGNNQIIKLRSSESTYRYFTTKNKKNNSGRMELKKYDPIVRRHVSFKEER